MKRLRELLEQLQLHFQVEIAIADLLDSQDKRIKKNEDHHFKSDVRLSSLEKRYSEILMVVKDINRKLDSSK